MNTINPFVLVGIILLSTIISCNSRESETRENWRNGDQKAMLDRQLTTLEKELSLTDAQYDQVKEVYTNIFNKQMELREKSTGDRSVMREKMVELNKEREKEMKVILDDEQFTKWKEHQQKMIRRGPQSRINN